MASLSLNNTAKAVLLAFFSASLLTACGGGGSTNRTSGGTDGGTTTPETTYKVTVSSSVPLKNVDVKILSLTGKEIAKGTITDGRTVSFDIKKSDTGQIAIAQISPQASASTYYDPALDKSATYNMTLHRVFSLYASAVTVDISPFSEIAYQRTLVRAGSMDLSNPNPTRITVADFSNSEYEVSTTLRVGLASDYLSSTPEFPAISKRSDYADLTFTVVQGNTVSTQAQYANAFFAAGHYMIQRNENPSDTTPYLTFAKRAAEDMRDGSLDGLTIIGDGTDGSDNSYKLKNPIVGPAPLNTKPAWNRLVAYNVADPSKDQSNTNTIKGEQQPVRENYAGRWSVNLLNFMNSLSKNDAEGKQGFEDFNFNEGIGVNQGIFTTATFGLHSFGAGNYKRAFGIEPITIAKGTQVNIRNNNCVPHLETAPTDVETTTYTPDCVVGVNADGESQTAPYNAIQALVGKYTGSDSCKLSISYAGIVTLSKGNLVFNNSLINRSEYTALIRASDNPDDQSYILNIASASASPVEFIQLKVENQKIISASAGTSDLYYPKTLTSPKLSCSFQ